MPRGRKPVIKEEYSSDSESELSLSSAEGNNPDNNNNYEEDGYDDDYEEEDMENLDNLENESENESDENSEDEKSNDDDSDDECVYKLTRTTLEREMLMDGELADDDEADIDADNKYVEPNKRITSPYMSNYERTRLISDRATQLSSGGQPMIKNKEGSINLKDLDHKTIAKIELESGTIPLYIERELPNGKVEVWYVKEMILKKREYVHYDKKGKISNISQIQSHVKKIAL